MITGANTNVRYRGIVFHVQTEDSGRANPLIVSHVYHGGTILASEKTDYSGRLDAEDLGSVVRGLIESQHKDMLKRLKAGAFDAAIRERLGPAVVGEGMETPTPLPDSDAEVERRLPPAPEPALRAPGVRAFGEGIVSQKPLDEVILEYLAAKARERAGDRNKSTRKSGSSG
jgi:hypothetical protein